ncbi:hypothetical protein [Bacillus thuringiensis]|nr:hypothetical protein [Bacillus thuringiensis]
MKTFGKVILTGALALGGLTVMNINTPEAHADGAIDTIYIASMTLTGR